MEERLPFICAIFVSGISRRDPQMGLILRGGGTHTRSHTLISRGPCAMKFFSLFFSSSRNFACKRPTTTSDTRTFAALATHDSRLCSECAFRPKALPSPSAIHPGSSQSATPIMIPRSITIQKTGYIVGHHHNRNIFYYNKNIVFLNLPPSTQ